MTEFTTVVAHRRKRKRRVNQWQILPSTGDAEPKEIIEEKVPEANNSNDET
jgi:hypothetical protein